MSLRNFPAHAGVRTGGVLAMGFLFALFLFLATVLAACAGTDSGTRPLDTPAAGQDAGGTQRAIPPGVTGKALDDLLRADLAARLAIPITEVTIRTTCDVTWPDGSLGVAEPGSVAAQVLSPGFLALLAARGQEYRYHGTARSFIAASFVRGANVDIGARCP